MKERNIGEVFDVNGVVLQVQKGDSCKDCYFVRKKDSLECLRECSWCGIIFKKLTTRNINYQIYVMQQFREGREIESRSDIWFVSKMPTWDWENKRYRLKPQNKYRRPYTDQELFELEIGRVLIRKDDKSKEFISKIIKRESGVYVFSGVSELNSDRLFVLFTWEDGSPCGVEVEENENG